MRHYRPSSDIPVTQHEVLARLADIHRLTWIKPQESYESSERRYRGTSRYDVVGQSEYGAGAKYAYVTTPPNPALPVEYSTTYGDWTELADTSEVTSEVYVIPPYCGGSDYSGSLVKVSNHKALTDALDAGEVEYISYYGGHGTFDIAIRVDSLLGSEWFDHIVDLISGLDDYPLADGDLHSQLEMESQNDAWESWGQSEFKQELSRYLASEIENGCETESEYAALFNVLGCDYGLLDFARDSDGDWILDDKVGLWFMELSEYANEYWVNEQGSDSYIDMAHVVKHGLTRKLWSDESTAKRDSLLAEIKASLESAYQSAYWDAFNLSDAPHHGFMCEQQWQHKVEDCTNES